MCSQVLFRSAVSTSVLVLIYAVCCTHSSYYRAVVLARRDGEREREYECFFVDYGNSEAVRERSVQPISSALLEVTTLCGRYPQVMSSLSLLSFHFKQWSVHYMGRVLQLVSCSVSSLVKGCIMSWLSASLVLTST